MALTMRGSLRSSFSRLTAVDHDIHLGEDRHIQEHKESLTPSGLLSTPTRGSLKATLYQACAFVAEAARKADSASWLESPGFTTVGVHYNIDRGLDKEVGCERSNAMPTTCRCLGVGEFLGKSLACYAQEKPGDSFILSGRYRKRAPQTANLKLMLIGTCLIVHAKLNGKLTELREITLRKMDMLENGQHCSEGWSRKKESTGPLSIAHLTGHVAEKGSSCTTGKGAGVCHWNGTATDNFLPERKTIETLVPMCAVGGVGGSMDGLPCAN
ncbi:hypothetical protein PAXINDRAFT_157470 [Paxillus involutus ATCC 200175]|uniref:Uncharacterized protein n=1 Tax=Paxillus involutus ATCC 200175 TaxID=664439 RepID=A0A0C9TUQ5_PAXIN|nr:hypothetical protein PAXINDRAFT_157470 [Paxillus involutus ATCC 200175]